MVSRRLPAVDQRLRQRPVRLEGSRLASNALYCTGACRVKDAKPGELVGRRGRSSGVRAVRRNVFVTSKSSALCPSYGSRTRRCGVKRAGLEAPRCPTTYSAAGCRCKQRTLDDRRLRKRSIVAEPPPWLRATGRQARAREARDRSDPVKTSGFSGKKGGTDLPPPPPPPPTPS